MWSRTSVLLPLAFANAAKGPDQLYAAGGPRFRAPQFHTEAERILDGLGIRRNYMSDLKRESMEQQVKGTVSDAKGRVKEAAGTLAGREDWEAEGQMDQAEGQVRKGVGKVGEKLSDAADALKDDDR